MKTTLTLFFVLALSFAKAQLLLKPSIEFTSGIKSKAINFALLPNRSFFMFELGTSCANYGFDKSTGKQSSASGNSMTYCMTIGASIFDGTYSARIDVIPYGFVSMNKYIGSAGAGVKILKNIDALNLYAGGYAQYSFSDYRKFMDAGFSLSYYFAQ